ncbi:sphingosine-1-phosphate phosphatase 1 [Paramormyrops kingsleyae]|uniref:sphingosine-1-phosphate phosphatase 1 n=1 Tax=Paramormyrops kingsleyae TaxID=1676925 RepID=UPI003B97126F
MANHLQRFIRLCQYLQDPHLVAKFQQMCGVKGTFPGKATEIAGQEEEKLQNGDCILHSADAETGGLSKRKDMTGSGKTALMNQVNPVRDAEEAAMRSAHWRLSAAPGSGKEEGKEAACELSEQKHESRSTVKPLRKNSLTGDVGQEFIIENKFLFYLFTFGTELGNEMFFIIFFPFLFWNIDAYVSRRLIVVWVLILYLGQCAKDLIRWTRPASPPVVKVEVFYNTEYSMPSTHAMTGTALPLSLFLLTYGRWEYPFIFGLSLVACWSLLVCVSRIYMGMHSVLEVITGFLYSLLILAVFQPLLNAIDHFYLTHRYAPLVIVTSHVGLGLLAFSLDTWSTSRSDTAQALGSGLGAALASRLNHLLGLMPDPALSQLPLSAPPLNVALLAKSFLRLVLGVLVLLAMKAVMKAVAIPLACRIFGIPGDDVRTARQHAPVELTYRYMVCGTLGFSCVFLVPAFFSCLNLS